MHVEKTTSLFAATNVTFTYATPAILKPQEPKTKRSENVQCAKNH